MTNKMRKMSFTVEGKLPFPIDMLRYDSAIPEEDGDSSNIEASLSESISGNEPMTYRINLIRFSEGFYPTNARWESFGWKVVVVDGEDEPVW